MNKEKVFNGAAAHWSAAASGRSQTNTTGCVDAFLSVQTETVAVWLPPRGNEAANFSRCSSAGTSFETDTNGPHVSSLFTSKFSFQLGEQIRLNCGATSNGSSTKL